MTRKELHDVFDEAVSGVPAVDLAEAAWAQGVGIRRRRRAAFAGGGTVLVAAAVAGIVAISGGLAPGEDVGPAVPTSTPTQVEPVPADLTQARTYLFQRTGTSTDLAASSLEPLAGQDVPGVTDLTDSSWEFVPMDTPGGTPADTGIDFAGSADLSAAVPTTLSFVAAENGDTLLSMSLDECGGATFQEDLSLGADGRFAGQPAMTDDQGCPEDVQTAEDLWMETLPTGGWLHQPHEDVLLLSMIVPPEEAPTQDGTDEPTGASTDQPTGASTGEPTGEGSKAPTGGPDVPGTYATRTFVLLREGTEAAPEELADLASLPSLDGLTVAVQEQLAGTAWTLHTDPELSATSDITAGEPAIGDAGTIAADVPTTVSFLDDPAGTLLSVELSCGPVGLQDDLGLDAGGWFPAQPTYALYADCPDAENSAASFWMTFLTLGGWLHQPSEDVLLLTVVIPENMGSDAERDPAPATSEEPGTAAPPPGTVSLGGGHAITLPDGWTDVPLWRDSGTVPDSTCLLPAGESELFFPFRWCTAGAEVRVGVDPDAASDAGGWWDPSVPVQDSPAEECYVARQDHGHPENAATFAPDPETGSTTVDGHPVQWLRWSALCGDGQEFTAEAWRVTDLGVEVRSMDGSQDLEPMVQGLVLDGGVRTDSAVVLEVTEPLGDTLSGEVQEWAGVYQGTGEQVTYSITEDTRCLITKPGAEAGADLQLGDCAALDGDLVEYPVVNVIVNAENEVVMVHRLAGF